MSVLKSLLLAALLVIFCMAAQSQTQLDLRTQARGVDFTGASATKPFKTGTSLPANCSTGEAYFKTTAPAGQNWYACTAANIWTLQAGGSGSGSSSGLPNYATSFVSQTSVTISGAAHGLGTSHLVVACYDSSTPATQVEPDHVTVDSTSFDITVAFSTAQTGSCVVNGTGGSAGGGSGGGAVASVFGRTGAIGKTKGDYNIADLGDVTAKQGNAALVQMFGGGTINAGDCARFDSGGNIISSGAACGTGSGGSAATTGSGLQQTGSEISVDTGSVPTFITVVPQPLTFPAIAAQSCAEQTFSLPAAALSDGLAPRLPSALPANLSATVFVSAADTITVRLCNPTAAAITPAANLTFSATIVRSF